VAQVEEATLKRLAVAVAATVLVPAAANATVYHFSFETTDGMFTVSGAATTANTLDSAARTDKEQSGASNKTLTSRAF
jgi:hypothetical protein